MSSPFRKAIITARLPRQVILPLQQGASFPLTPLVKVGDEVVEGQKIADTEKYVSAPLHAPISGRVTKISSAITITAQAGAQKEALYSGSWAVDELSPGQIRKIVREAGIVGLREKIETVIINGCEEEPYIAADYRLMLERPADVIYGARAVAKAVAAEKIIIGLEDNKRGQTDSIKVVVNVGTAVAITEAVKFGKPLIELVMTVAGPAIKEPQNLRVRLGTQVAELIEECGGLIEENARMSMGDPLTGLTAVTLDMPVLKGTNCLLVGRLEE